MKELNVCLDSGAFTIYQKCSKLGITDGYHQTEKYKAYLEDYITYVFDNLSALDFYITLDVLYNAQATYETFEYMNSCGLEPLPVFHFGEDFSYLKKYLDGSPYICVGGIAKGVNKKELVQFMDSVFDYVKDADVRVHGLGVTDAFLLKRYPWYSVDSSSLMQPAIYGGIFFPQTTFDGALDFLGRIRYVRFSEKSENANDFYRRFSPLEQESILHYIEAQGFTPQELGENLRDRVLCNIHFFNNRLRTLQEVYGKSGLKMNRLYIAGLWSMPWSKLCEYSSHFDNLGWLVSFANVNHSNRILKVKKSFSTERKRRVIK